jgi:nucleotide-binding universal stress UspA family protein
LPDPAAPARDRLPANHPTIRAAAALAAGADGPARGAYRSGRLLGAVTEDVLRHATLPLLLMR